MKELCIGAFTTKWLIYTGQNSSIYDVEDDKKNEELVLKL